MQELAEVSATRLARHLSLPMWSLDRDQVSELLTAELAEQRVSAIVVRDEDGRTLFAAKHRTADGIVDSDGEVSGNLINVNRDVKLGDENIGVVSIYVSPETMLYELRQFRQGAVITVLLVNLVIIFIMLFLVGRVIIQPLQKLTLAAERMSKGDLNQSLDLRSKDEIGYLSTAFSRMQNSLKFAMQKLVQSRRNAA